MPDRPTIDDEEDANPYGVTALDTAPRCPDCANEMESEDAIICLHCGYNSRTRVKIEARAVDDVTGVHLVSVAAARHPLRVGPLPLPHF